MSCKSDNKSHVTPKEPKITKKYFAKKINDKKYTHSKYFLVSLL
jgi:hypothetical protein